MSFPVRLSHAVAADDAAGIRARQLEIRQDTTPAEEGRPPQALSDTWQSRLAQSISRWNTGSLRTGRIVHVQPHLHRYRVSLGRVGGDIVCCKLSATGLLPWGVKEDSVLPPGADVLVYWTPGEPFGVILGVLPPLTTAGANYVPDWLTQAGGTGFFQEAYHRELLTHTAPEIDLYNFSAGRSIDGGSAGELAWLGPLGGGLFMDAFMAFLRMNEACGLWLFHFDNLLRLHGYNMDVRTAVSEQVIRNDQGEGYGYRGVTAYPWEAMGLWSPKNPFQEIAPEKVIHEGVQGAYELIGDKGDLRPFFRAETYEGYCGQAGLRQVLLPPEDTSGENRYGDENQQPCPVVFREQIGLDGSYSLASARSLAFVKRLAIPTFNRIKLVEDAKGDDATEESPGEYKFAGRWGDGKEHKVGNFKNSGKYDHVLLPSMVLDVAAYELNWKGVHPFVYHEKDFKVFSGQDLKKASVAASPHDFAALKSQPFLPAPQAVPLRVDDRYSDQDYYPTTAGLWILPDGSIVLRDAYGSELRMTGGNIYLSAPGDVYLQPGKSLVSYAGKDCVLRAQDSVDITAAKHDVRVKAEVNCEILAGNGGKQGRLLLENQAQSISHQYEQKYGTEVEGSGILLKAKATQVAALASEVYLRTLAGEDAAGRGTITLDAAKGERDIVTVAGRLTNYATYETADVVGHRDGQVAVHRRTSFGADVPGDLHVRGSGAFCSGGVSVRGDVMVVDGHIGTSMAKSLDGRVNPLDGVSSSLLQSVLSQFANSINQAASEKQQDFQSTVEQGCYAEGKIGNEALIAAMAFAPRTPEQMGTEQWVLPETAWQQLARLSGQSLPAWEESPITYQGREMLPHPGKEAWKDEPRFLKADLRYHNPQTGEDVPSSSDSPYSEEPQIQASEPVIAANEYRTI